MRIAPALLVLLAQTAATWFMTGFIWTMQVLHYPLFAEVGVDAFPAYETAHNRLFFRVAGPVIAVVLITVIAQFFVRSSAVPLWAPILDAVLLFVIIMSTARFQAPAHVQLAEGFDPAVLRGLVQSNWVRTVAWTTFGLLDLWMVFRTALVSRG